MTSRVCVITGATEGIGKATAQALAEQGWQLAIIGRNAEKGAAVIQELTAATDNSALRFFQADLSAQAEIRHVAQEILNAYPRVDVLLNNAGAIFMRRQDSIDGIEMTWALNHLAYFLLTQLLCERLIHSAPARIINVASTVHRGMTLQFDDPELKQNYAGFKAYRHSKLANILFTRALAKRLNGTNVTANCLHPGAVGSHFGRNNGTMIRCLMKLGSPFLLTPTQGAQTSIYLATSPTVGNISGEYFARQQIVQPSAAALDDDAAERLWALSEQQCRPVGW